MNRRTFATIAGLSWMPGEARPRPNGISKVSRNLLMLASPPDRPPEGSLRYALAFPFQADPETMGLMVMRMTEETPNYGFLDGSDVVLLDQFSEPGRIYAATRNELEGGRLFLKSPLIGGFVPRGALRANGRPHPHAGTGFGVGQAHWFEFPNRRFRWGDPGRQDMNELYQLSYDGTSFKTRRSEVRAQNGDDPLRIGTSGWSVLVTGIKTAIPDGDDLLLAALAARADRSAVGVGVIRWVRQSGQWKPSAFDAVVTANVPVPQGPNPMEQCPWMEPSVDRDPDGRLLFSARGADVPKGLGYTLRVWRSEGSRWTEVLDLPNARLNSPVTVNVAADGTAYLISNPYDPAFIPENRTNGRGREKLVLWPLKGDRTGIESPLLIRDCLAEFGQPPSADKGEKWMADHPNGQTVRLKDGNWHHVLSYRICHSPRHASSGVSPSPQSGSYVEEVQSRGPARPVWRFATQ